MKISEITQPAIGNNPKLSTRTRVTTNKNFDAGTSHDTFSKYIHKTGDTGGTSLSKVQNIKKSATGTTGTSTKRYVRPGGSGTQTVSDIGTGKITRTKFQLKGPQSWAYDK